MNFQITVDQNQNCSAALFLPTSTYLVIMTDNNNKAQF